MAIYPADAKNCIKPHIDLSGPDGNAFVLLGYARRLSKSLDLDYKAVSSEMMAGDYDNLVEVFDKYFGEHVDIYHYKRVGAE